MLLHGDADGADDEGVAGPGERMDDLGGVRHRIVVRRRRHRHRLRRGPVHGGERQARRRERHVRAAVKRQLYTHRPRRLCGQRQLIGCAAALFDGQLRSREQPAHFVVVPDHHLRGRVRSFGAGEVAQRDLERLVGLVVTVVEYGDRHLGGRLPRGDGDRSAGRRVVRARRGRTVRRGPVEGHRRYAGGGEFEGHADAGVVLVGRRVPGGQDPPVAQYLDVGYAETRPVRRLHVRPDRKFPDRDVHLVPVRHGVRIHRQKPGDRGPDPPPGTDRDPRDAVGERDAVLGHVGVERRDQNARIDRQFRQPRVHEVVHRRVHLVVGVARQPRTVEV